MAEVDENNFWDTDIKDLPGAIEITDETPIVLSVGGIPYDTIKQSDVKSVDNILEIGK